MEEFRLECGGDYLRIEIVQLFGFPDAPAFGGGYDTESTLEINSEGFKVTATIWVSTGELLAFYKELKETFISLSGTASLKIIERNLNLQVSFRGNGLVEVQGNFTKQSMYDNTLIFHFESDQSYIKKTLRQLEIIFDKYREPTETDQ